MALDDLARQSFDFLTTGLGPEEMARAQALVGGPDGSAETVRQRPFSTFRPSHLREAKRLLDDLNGILRDLPDETGIRLAWRRVLAEAASGNEAMAQDVWSSFVTHASTSVPAIGALKVPPHVFVDPTDPARSFDASKRVGPTGPLPIPAAPSAIVDEGSEERPLDWFREDLFFAEHHRWWHVVYPSYGVSPLDRHGELFVYMHQQMLARYRTERFVAGLPDVVARSDMTAPVRWGYDPDARPPTVAIYSARDKDEAPSGDNLATARSLMARMAALIEDIEAGEFRDAQGAPPLTVNTLGGVLEANASFRDLPWASKRADVHNEGHVVLADLSPVTVVGNREISGIMGTTSLAPQDHVFWEWHKQVDDVVDRLRVKAGPRAPEIIGDIEIRKGDGPVFGSPDIILMTYDALREAGVDPASATPAELDAAGGRWFGEERWDRSFRDGEDGTTATLRTYMLEGRFNVRGQDANVPFMREHLNHDRFATFVRVENRSAREVRATVRLFLTLEAKAAERRWWIEMDRIPVALAPLSRRVVARLGEQASVVRKSNGRAPWPYPFGTYEEHLAQQTVPIQSGAMPDEYCECGWPFSLYLPRGSTEGSPFVLAAIVTRDDALDMERGGECGSRSFCGKRDPVYPDRKPMGYPFDRDWIGGDGAPMSISDGLGSIPNVAAKRVVIRHDGLQRLRSVA
ncbi:hypothetical protein [uncultured Enterovirga sp.]|uniref:hypothetical protein n=1 Tax=uncultured Enterovirga sp. TaxID=2026352 RepID=UPI0035CA599F